MATMNALDRLIAMQESLPEEVKQSLEVREATIDDSGSNEDKKPTGTLWYSKSVTDAQDKAIPHALRGIMGPSYGLVSVYDTVSKHPVKVKDLSKKDLEWYDEITQALLAAAKEGKESLKLDLSFEITLTQFGIEHFLDGRAPAVELGKPKLR